jgi:hypothetical protein
MFWDITLNDRTVTPAAQVFIVALLVVMNSQKLKIRYVKAISGMFFYTKSH